MGKSRSVQNVENSAGSALNNVRRWDHKKGEGKGEGVLGGWGKGI